MGSTYTKRARYARFVGFTLAVAFLVGCSLPEPDGTEAAIIEKAAGLPTLQSASGRSPKAVVANGLLLSPQVRLAASTVSASADEVRVQRAALFPSLGLSITGGTGTASEGDPSLELTGRQLLLDFGKTKRAITVADLDLQIDYISFHQSVDDTLFETLTTYDSVRKNVLLLEIRRVQLNALRELLRLVTERVDNGAAPTSDLLETQKSVQSAAFLVHDTELALAEARDRISILTGQRRGGRVPTPRAGSCVSPDDEDGTRIAQLNLVRAELDLETAERAHEPRAYLEPIVRRKVGEGGISVGLNVGVDSDLLQGGALGARVNAAQKTVEGANAGVAAARRGIQLDAVRLRREIAAAGRKTTLLKRQIALLTHTRQLLRSQYFDLGTREVSELLDNEDEYYNRQAELIEVRSDLLGHQLECAIREDRLRQQFGLESKSLYAYPLSPRMFSTD